MFGIIVLALSLAKIHECQATTVRSPSNREGGGPGDEPLELRRSQPSGRRRGAGASGEFSSIGKRYFYFFAEKSAMTLINTY